MIDEDPDILCEKWFKSFIIDNSNKHEIAWFCSDSDITSEMIYSLLDDVGINMIFCNHNRMCMINDIITCGKDISKLYDNFLFLELLFLLGEYYYYIDSVCAFNFMNYIIDNHNDSVVDFFNKFNEKSQLYVIENCDLSSFYFDILRSCKDCCSLYILDRISSLNDFSYDDLLSIFSRDIHIPERLLCGDFVIKISTMYNVCAYRGLILALNHNNDVSHIEILRRKFYDSFLLNYNKIFDLIKSDILSGNDSYFSICKHLNCFGGFDSVLSDAFVTGDIDSLFCKAINRITSDIVIDYLFYDIPYNVLIDIRELLGFSSKTDVLDDSSLSFYSGIVFLDSMSISDKVSFLNVYKGFDIVSKFYDDYLVCRRLMLNLINGCILNSTNVFKFMSSELSCRYGVPIYILDGSKFYTFVRSSGILKSSCLTSHDLNVFCDGVSYSLDGGGKLNLYSNPHDYFIIAYDSIPVDQLVHVFEVDSYSNYKRDSNNVPCNDNGTSRINRLYVPDDLICISSSYNELVVSQPNGNVDEFNKCLLLPRPFALYCYDDITENDIKAAKDNNLGIIFVKTNSYNVDRSSEVNLLSRSDDKITYFKGFDKYRKL